MSFITTDQAQVSIERINKLMEPENSYCILIMGPTGSGKSALIEALAGEEQSLGISKDQLDGFTQEVACYKFKNSSVSWDDEDSISVYLIDTPGFSDTKISEMEIITKVKIWMADEGIHSIHNILYLCPISDNRVSGRKRRTIQMLQALLREGTARRVTIVTTMWDMISRPQAKARATANFTQLRDDIWKDLVGKGARIDKFQNTYDSALEIIKAATQASGFSPFEKTKITHVDASAAFLYQELLDRIHNAQQEKAYLHQEHLQLITTPDALLESVVMPRLDEVKMGLNKFIGQLVGFGQPPPARFQGSPERIVYQDRLDNVTEAKDIIHALKRVLLGGGHSESQSRTLALKERLRRAKAELAISALALIEYGVPPEGYRRVVFDYEDLNIKGRIAQARWGVMERLNKKH